MPVATARVKCANAKQVNKYIINYIHTKKHNERNQIHFLDSGTSQPLLWIEFNAMEIMKLICSVDAKLRLKLPTFPMRLSAMQSKNINQQY